MDTTYLVYVDDSGNENQDLLTALAIPVDDWAEALERWKKFREWVHTKFGIPPSTELHALDLGTNSSDGRGPLVGLRKEQRNKVAKSAFSTLRSTPTLRALSIYKNVPEGSGSLYEPLIEFLGEFCQFHDSFAVVWYDGTAKSLEDITRSVHRALPDDRRVLEDPRGYSSADSHLIQMADFVAYSAHHAVLNDKGIGPSDTYLREKAYASLLPNEESPGLVWPGAVDGDDFPVFRNPTGIRNYP